jgi:hypothetical protein
MRKQWRFAEALWAQGIAHRRAAYADLGISKRSRPLPRPTRNQIRIDHVHITEAYALHCSGIEISTADISKVYEEGHRLLAAGTNDSALGIALRAFAIKLSETE